MGVDQTLTRERALEEIGQLVSHDHDYLKVTNGRVSGIETSVVEGVYDSTYTIYEGAGMMSRLQCWREAQIKFGFN